MTILHVANVTSGLSSDVNLQLIEAAKLTTCSEYEKCVVVLMDEMHIRVSLVYDKVSGTLYNSKALCITIHVGALVGFANLGEIDTKAERYYRFSDISRYFKNIDIAIFCY